MMEIKKKNKENKRKLSVRLVISALVCLVLAGFGAGILPVGLAGHLTVDFLDVGQGDAALIRTPYGQTILIDGGPDDKILRRLGERLPFYHRRLDYVLYSHYHADHITGLVSVLRRYEVKNLIYAPSGYSSALLKTLEETAQYKGVAVRPLSGTATLDFGPGCSLRILNPALLGVAADENNSLVAKLDCAGRSFLFSGDNNHKAEKALIVFASGKDSCARFVCDLRADILKASHHGSNTASSEAFLRAVKPELIVVSAGTDNRFGHPHPAVLERAAALGTEVRRTDQDGSIRISGP